MKKVMLFGLVLVSFMVMACSEDEEGNNLPYVPSVTATYDIEDFSIRDANDNDLKIVDLWDCLPDGPTFSVTAGMIGYTIWHGKMDGCNTSLFSGSKIVQFLDQFVGDNVNSGYNSGSINGIFPLYTDSEMYFDFNENDFMVWEKLSNGNIIAINGTVQ